MTDNFGESKMVLGGPMFEAKETERRKSIYDKDGAHYNIFKCKNGMGLDFMRDMTGPDDLNFWLFSTSGVHGTYTTVEEIEKYIENPDPDEGHHEITFLLVQPRIVSMTYGTIDLTKEDIPLIKSLRQKSWDAVQTIGRDES